MRERKFNPNEELVTTEQIEILLGLDADAAEREYAYMLEQLNSPSEELLLAQFCELQGIDTQEAFYCLNPPEMTYQELIESLKGDVLLSGQELNNKT